MPVLHLRHVAQNQRLLATRRPMRCGADFRSCNRIPFTVPPDLPCTPPLLPPRQHFALAKPIEAFTYPRHTPPAALLAMQCPCLLDTPVLVALQPFRMPQKF
jgi:hypothetical protein